MIEKNTSLLPNGLKDLLPADAEKEAYIITQLMEEFSRFGYRRVKPPLVEFEDTLLHKGPGKALSNQTFRIMDPLSGRMMGVRADTTAQISRIANSRLNDEPRPLRLSYAADVLKVKGSQLRPERQFCQVGCEMIGIETAQDDAELCLTALNSLSRVGVKNTSLDLSIPSLVDILYDFYKCDDAQREAFNKLLQKRDRDGLADYNNEASNAIIGLLDASGPANEAIEFLETLDLPSQTTEALNHLKEVHAHLLKAFEVYGLSDVTITIDLIERRGFDYQNGMSFTIFSKDARGELGRGGRYFMNEDSDKPASGFTLYMDSILNIVPVLELTKTQEVKRDCDWQEIKKLQEDGFAVSRK